MTFQEAKDEIAKLYGYNSWKETDFYHIDAMNETKPGEPNAEHLLLEEAAKRFAQSACKEQREICAALHHEPSKWRELIKNAPEPTML